MQIKLKVDDLKAVLGSVKNTYGSKVLSSLNGILIDADANGDCKMTSSNGLETTRASFTAQVIVAGQSLVDGTAFHKLAGTFDKGDVELTSNGMGLDIEHPAGALFVSGQDPTLYPALQEMIEDSSFMIPAKEFATALDKVKFACVKNPVNATDQKFAGIGLTIISGQATLAATDRKRIATYSFPVPSANDINLVIDLDSLNGLKTVSGNIAVRLSASGVVLETNDTTYQGPVLAQKFPDLSRYFGAAHAAEAAIPVDRLKSVLERIAIIGSVSKMAPETLFTFDSATSILDIDFQSVSGNVKESIQLKSYSGPDIAVKLDVDIIHDGIKRIDKDHVEALLYANDKPVIFRPENETDFGFLAMAVV